MVSGKSVVVLVTLLCLISISMGEVKAAPVSIVNIQLQPYADAYVNQLNPDTNYDSIRPYLYVRSLEEDPDAKNARIFIAFDLKNIPPGSYVTYAKLFLFMYQAPTVTRTYECDRSVSIWQENIITWNNQPAVEGLGPKSASIGTTPNVWISWDVKTWIQSFVLGDVGATPNYGWRISDADENSATIYDSYFRSAEYSDPDFLPTLTMSYYPPHLELEVPTPSFDAGKWVKLTVHRRDFNNIDVLRGDLRVNLSSTSTSVNKKFSTTQGGPPVNAIFIDNGHSSKDFWYYDDRAGSWNIRVWTTDYANYGDDTKSETVNPVALDHFEFDTISSPKTAAVSFPVTIRAKDKFGNVVMSYSDTNIISDTTGTINPTMTSAFVSGVWSGNVIIRAVARNVKLSTTGGGKSGVSNAFDVVAGPPAKLAMLPPIFTMAGGIPYSPLKVVILDANGFETNATSSVTVALSTTSSDGKFRIKGTSVDISTVLITVGKSYALVDYYDMKGGTWTLTASASGLTSGAAAVTVIPDITAPVTTISIDGPKYQTGTTLYVSGSTVFELSATDEASGVKKTEYRMDGGAWANYTNPFIVLSLPEGPHSIGYRSQDKAGNVEAEKVISIFLDKTGPSVTDLEPIGPLVQRTGSVRFKAIVEDQGSGVANVVILLDNVLKGSMSNEGKTYTRDLEVTAGSHRWLVDATDNLGNTTIAIEVEFTLAIDNQPPNISEVTISPSSPVWGDSVSVTASISDDLSSVSSAVIRYSTDAGSTWNEVPMVPPMPPLPVTRYEGVIPSQSPMAEVIYNIRATDALGNVANSSTLEYAVGIPLLIYVGFFAIVFVIVVGIALRFRKKPQPLPPPPP